ncbi:MAG: glycosyltransferase family 39 protein [bacterium]|nr:glycosyltransferase family 39 protein [bacterium]
MSDLGHPATPLSETRRDWQRPLFWLFLGAAVIGGIVVRWRQAALPYTPDEEIIVAKSARLLSGGAPIFLDPAQSSPVYRLLLGFWVRLFGSTPLATAGLSLVITLVGIGLMYALAKRMGGAACGLLSIILFWSSYLGIQYSTETSPLMLGIVLVTATNFALYQYFQIGRSSSLWWYGATAALGVYTNPSLLLVLFSQTAAISLLQRRWRITPVQWQRWWRLEALLFMVVAPVAVHYLRLLPAFITEGISSATPAVPSRQFPFSVMHGYLYPTWTASWSVNLRVGILIILTSFPLLFTFHRERRWLTVTFTPPNTPVSYLLVVGALPIFLLAGFDVGVPKYYVVFGPMFIVAMAVAISRMSDQLRLRMVGGLLAGVLAILNLYYAFRGTDGRILPVVRQVSPRQIFLSLSSPSLGYSSLLCQSSKHCAKQ